MIQSNPIYRKNKNKKQSLSNNQFNDDTPLLNAMIRCPPLKKQGSLSSTNLPPIAPPPTFVSWLKLNADPEFLSFPFYFTKNTKKHQKRTQTHTPFFFQQQNRTPVAPFYAILFLFHQTPPPLLRPQKKQ